MKKLLPIFLILLFSCNAYYQTYKVSSTNCKPDVNNFLISESDTFKIIYSFWSDHGIVAFTFYNKTEKPIYIDWKKSSCIFNGLKRNYWDDIVYSSSTIVSAQKDVYSTKNKYSADPNYLFQRYGITTSFSTAQTFKPEQITFIPPKSFISVSKFLIGFQTIIGNKDIALENRQVLCKKTFDQTSSPLTFRNYITISMDEKFNDSFMIDDHFYLGEVKEFKYKGDIIPLAQPNLYYFKIKDKSYGHDKFKFGDKVIFSKKSEYIIGTIKALKTIQESSSSTSTKATVEYMDKSGNNHIVELDLNRIFTY